ncbi:hypothetical protein KIW84_074620 [Lathyrus oleraceus]|uniref:Uncharacterized protein n=1 Tax=Pisum sativum TaxID=3888 RepID=A0A9D5A057_PEA|nr:hypothetical protein KIW84_074620 [Pisum sativum]
MANCIEEDSNIMFQRPTPLMMVEQVMEKMFKCVVHHYGDFAREYANFKKSGYQWRANEYDYENELYETCYSPVIYPVNGEALWTKLDDVDLQPPPIKRQPRRPKKKRNREVGEMVRDETHLKRANHGIKCSRFHKEGHNKATCKLPQPVVPLTQVAEGASTQ